MSGIRLHPEFGLNTTMAICIVCNEPTGELAMLGASCKTEAPKYSIVSPDPCESCKLAYLSKGTLLIGRTSEHGELNEGILVLEDDAFRRLFNQEPPENKIVYAEDKVLITLREQHDIEDTPKPTDTKSGRPAKTT